MDTAHQHGPAVVVIFCLERVLLYSLLLGFSGLPVVAQKGQPAIPPYGVSLGNTPATFPPSIPRFPDGRVVFSQGDNPREQGAAESDRCSLQPFPGIADTIGLLNLQVPAKARKEYEKACAALKRKRLPESEQHLWKATKIHPKYAAAWVMLGQVLEERQQFKEARAACLQASITEPNAVPPYLCLAEMAGRERRWREVLALAKHAVDLDPVNDAYAYFFAAFAYFNLDHLAEAQTSALKAEAIDKAHNEPRVQFLLAQIYEERNDVAAAIVELQAYIKLAPNSSYSDMASRDLAKLEARGAK